MGTQVTETFDPQRLKDRSVYPVFAQENVRYRDLDTQGHVNNAGLHHLF